MRGLSGFAFGVNVTRLAAAVLQRVDKLQVKAHLATDIVGRYIWRRYTTPRASLRTQQHRRLFPFTKPLTYGAGWQQLMP
jgi:hypothetical protein